MDRGDHHGSFIIATTPADAAAALRSIPRSRRHHGVDVLVPHIVPYGVAIGGCGCDLEVIAARFRGTLGDGPTPVRVRVCTCRDARHLPGRLLLRHAAITVTGRKGRWWWRSPAERLARALVDEGHAVTFVERAQAGP
ncbi:MAG: hypothetical protein U0Q55_01280 [Vicinamibacterales bacterium]